MNVYKKSDPGGNITMITMGIGRCAKTTKIIGINLVLQKLDTSNTANQVYGEAAKTAGIGKEEIQKIFS